MNCGPAASSVSALPLLFQLWLNTSEILRMQQRDGASCHADSLPVSRCNKCTRNRCLGQEKLPSAKRRARRGGRTAVRFRFVFTWKRAREQSKGEAPVHATATSLQPRPSNEGGEVPRERGPGPAGAAAHSCLPKARRICLQLCSEGKARRPIQATPLKDVLVAAWQELCRARSDVTRAFRADGCRRKEWQRSQPQPQR